ncbi:GNAT family N-acetyltransferase [Mucisphaera sp.]|uniref:GNAT family N-acetyltransferase n=1 Tax=Mucisphaera sp. TaxID=2913024 RepID=UPI003D0DAC80
MRFDRPGRFTLRDGREVAVRSAELDDAEGLLSYVDGVRRETRYILMSPEDALFSVEGERAWVQSHLDDPCGVNLVVEAEGEIVSCAGLQGNGFMRRRHATGLGIAIREAWRGVGLGRYLMQTLIDWAGRHPELTVVELGVYADNEPAQRLYRSVGFEVDGRKRRAILRDGEQYVDELIMSLWVGDAAEGFGVNCLSAVRSVTEV